MASPPLPNFKVLHIEPSKYTPTAPRTSSSSSSSSSAEAERDMCVLQFEIFHLSKLIITMEGSFYDYEHAKLRRITNPRAEIETSVLYLGNSDERAARDMSRTLSGLEIPKNCHAEIIGRVSEVARNSGGVDLDVKIGGITKEFVSDDLVMADLMAMQVEMGDNRGQSRY